MTRQKITLRLEGPDKNDNHLELSIFAEKVRHFLDFLKSSAKDSGADGVVFQHCSICHGTTCKFESRERDAGRNKRYWRR